MTEQMTAPKKPTLKAMQKRAADAMDELQAASGMLMHRSWTKPGRWRGISNRAEVAFLVHLAKRMRMQNYALLLACDRDRLAEFPHEIPAMLMAMMLEDARRAAGIGPEGDSDDD